MTPISDAQLAEFDRYSQDDRCIINMHYYRRVRERLRRAEQVVVAFERHVDKAPEDDIVGYLDSLRAAVEALGSYRLGIEEANREV